MLASLNIAVPDVIPRIWGMLTFEMESVELEIEAFRYFQ